MDQTPTTSQVLQPPLGTITIQLPWSYHAATPLVLPQPRSGPLAPFVLLSHAQAHPPRVAGHMQARTMSCTPGGSSSPHHMRAWFTGRWRCAVCLCTTSASYCWNNCSTCWRSAPSIQMDCCGAMLPAMLEPQQALMYVLE
jgi:hypothetical protein